LIGRADQAKASNLQQVIVYVCERTALLYVVWMLVFRVSNFYAYFMEQWQNSYPIDPGRYTLEKVLRTASRPFAAYFFQDLR
jgi:hypothetical protein